MYKIIKLGIALLVVGTFWGFSSKVQACVNWCDPVCWIKNTDGSCAGYATSCCDGGGPLTGELCDPNQYACNREGGCCNLGGGGSSGGYTPPECDYSYIENCPAGYPRGNTVISQRDVYNSQLLACGNGVGSAQTLGGCAESHLTEKGGHSATRPGCTPTPATRAALLERPSPVPLSRAARTIGLTTVLPTMPPVVLGRMTCM